MNTLEEHQRKAGKANLAKHGREFYVALAKKSHEAIKGKYGKDYYSRIRHGEKPSLDRLPDA